MTIKNMFKPRKTVPGSIDTWITTHKAVSDVAHRHLVQILKSGPIHPSALGAFRKKYDIPAPIGFWLATFSDIKRATIEETPNGQPAVLLAEKMGDASYWEGYRSDIFVGDEATAQAKPLDKTAAQSTAWQSLGLNGDKPGAIRAEVFRAFILKNFGASGQDMVVATQAFVREAGMSFSEFFGGMKAKEISQMDWGNKHCVWIPTGATSMRVEPVMGHADNEFAEVPAACQTELEYLASKKVPERIDFEKIAQKYRATRESILVAYISALGRILRRDNKSVPAIKTSSENEPEHKRNEGVGYWRRLFRALAGRWGTREKYLQKWAAILLDSPKQDAQITLTDGRVLTGMLVGVDDDFFTLQIGNGTELLERENIKEIKGVDRTTVPGASRRKGLGIIRAWYADRGFGFIRDDAQDYFFRRDLIDVPDLAAALDGGKTRQFVHFFVLEGNRGGQYPCVRIDRWLVDHSNTQDSSLAPENYYPQGHYCFEKGRLGEAKYYLEKVLENRDDPHFLSALKDLAELFNRTDPNAAYDLLEKHRSSFDDDETLASFDKMEVSYLLRAKRQDEALNLICTLLARTDLSPNQQEYYRKLKESIASGNPGRLVEWDMGPDDSLRMALDAFCDVLARKCDFHGLEARGISCEEDLPDLAEDGGRALNELLETVEKARSNLIGDIPKQEVVFYRDAHFSQEMARFDLTEFYLRRKLGDGKSAMYWLRHYFWRQALCLVFADGGYRPDEVLTYLVWRPRPGPVRTGYFAETIPLLICGVLQWSKQEELRRIVEDGAYRKDLSRHFPVDPETRDQLQFWVELHELNQLMPAFDGVFEGMGIPLRTVESPHSWARRKIHSALQECLGELSRNNFASVALQLKELSNVSARDKERVDGVIQFLEKAGEYAGTLEYAGRAALAGQLRTMRKEFEYNYVLSDITLLTTDICYPCLNAAWKLVSDDYEKVSSQPIALSLEHAHGSQYFLEDEEVKLRLRLRIEDPTCPAISSVTLCAIGENAPDGNSGIAYFDGPLTGGDNGREVGITLWPTEEEQTALHGVARIQVEYTKETEAHSVGREEFELDFSISETEFEPIDNPYLNALGHPAEGNMFVGRQALLDEIVSVFKETDGGQCYVLYGQRRSGKSSVLHNVKNALESEGFVYTKISASAFSNPDAKETFTRELESKLQRDLSVDAVMPDVGGKNWAARLRHMGHYVKSVGKINWVVGIDEFTYLYDFFLEDRDANRGTVRDFLRFLKAMLEEGVFHLLIIGQESVVQMQKDFPNEFAIWRLHRLTYLGEDAVRQLVDDPIAKMLDNGETISRYKGNAIQRLYKITAGQPWFTQKFCSRMVDYLNESKTPDITESVVRAVERQLCKGEGEEGEEKIPSEEFEPFVNLMAPEVDEETLVKFYYDVAVQTESDAAWVPRSDLDARQAALVPLLDKRGLVVVRDDKVRLRMGLFASWLRANPGRTAESFGGKAE